MSWKRTCRTRGIAALGPDVDPDAALRMPSLITTITKPRSSGTSKKERHSSRHCANVRRRSLLGALRSEWVSSVRCAPQQNCPADGSYGIRPRAWMRRRRRCAARTRRVTPRAVMTGGRSASPAGSPLSGLRPDPSVPSSFRRSPSRSSCRRGRMRRSPRRRCGPIARPEAGRRSASDNRSAPAGLRP